MVQDEQRVCELAANVLKECDYRVITANPGEEALRRSNEFEGIIHLLPIDIVMAGWLLKGIRAPA